jgi:hypothetical protein
MDPEALAWLETITGGRVVRVDPVSQTIILRLPEFMWPEGGRGDGDRRLPGAPDSDRLPGV